MNSSLDFKYRNDAKMSMGHYRKDTIYTTNNSSVFTQTAGSQDIIFTLPSRVVNWSKCRLEFDVSIPAGGAGVRSCLWADRVPFLDMSLMDGRGVELARVTDCSTASKFMNPVHDKWDCFISRSSVLGASTAVSSGVLDSCVIPAKSAVASSSSVQSFTPNLNGVTTGLVPVPTSNNVVLNTTNAAEITNGSRASGVSDMGPLGQQRLVIGADNAVLAVRYSIPLEKLCAYNQVLSEDADLWLGSNQLRLHIRTQSKDRWGFSATAQATIDIDAFANTTIGDISVTNMRLQLFSQNNPELATRIYTSTVEKGVAMPISRLNYQVKNVSGTSGTFLGNWSSNYGRLLRRVITGFSDGSNKTNLKYLHANNGANDMLSTLQSTLDVDKLQPNVVDFSRPDAWLLYHKSLFEGSATPSESAWKNNMVWVDSFSEVPLCKAREYDALGLTTGKETLDVQTYSIDITRSNTNLPQILDAHMFFVYSSTLLIRPGGEEIVISE